MNQKERKKVLDERAKLKGYRNRLMLLKDAVPNINELWGDNKKMMDFFESGKAAKYEDHLSINHGKPIDKLRKVEIKTVLTVDLFNGLKAAGVNDKTIMADFKLNSNQLNAWKKKNGVLGIRLKGGKPAHKKKLDKGDVEVVKVDMDRKESPKQKDLVSSLEENLHEQQCYLGDSNLKIRELEASLEVSEGKVSELEEAAEIALNAQKQTLEDLRDSNEEYRKLEVDYLNQSSELTRVKDMLEKLKRTEQINVWLMEQHIGFVAQLDEMTV